MKKQGKGDPIPDLAQPKIDYLKEKHVLFVLPGTNIEVSLARVDDKSFQVYFRRGPNGQYPNLGYIHVDMKTMEADYSLSEIKLKRPPAKKE